eukprot:GHVS01088492.1.p1 GENE.GHVS01088492.1~~GHVS01088492.1.p1  ORF type:complete len:467 (-),score=68.37 GHVS01088492.1:135-1535(-)
MQTVRLMSSGRYVFAGGHRQAVLRLWRTTTCAHAYRSSNTTFVLCAFVEALHKFLGDEKEVDELFMVTDEELKMMCRICPKGGCVEGPFLKEMSHVVHTEYELKGELPDNTSLIDAFKLSMFAPTVTGSPMKNAVEKIYAYEKTSRRYYSGALMALGTEAGQPFLDSCINIRMQEIEHDGTLRIRVGATLVKDSVPSEEVKETEWKIRGTMAALVNQQAAQPLKLSEAFGAEGPKAACLRDLLCLRNTNISKFWLQNDLKIQPIQPLGKKALLIDNEDDFIHMLDHMLRKLGLATSVVPWRGAISVLSSSPPFDLVVVGPGPGDPMSASCLKMLTLQSIFQQHLLPQSTTTTTPFVCVCLGQQCLGRSVGLRLSKKLVPLQGVQRRIDLFGAQEYVGFYNSFFVHHDPQHEFLADVEVSVEDGEIYAMRSKKFVSFQFHPESLLTRNGPDIIGDALRHLWGTVDVP